MCCSRFSGNLYTYFLLYRLDTAQHLLKNIETNTNNFVNICTSLSYFAAWKGFCSINAIHSLHTSFEVRRFHSLKAFRHLYSHHWSAARAFFLIWLYGHSCLLCASCPVVLVNSFTLPVCIRVCVCGLLLAYSSDDCEGRLYSTTIKYLSKPRKSAAREKEKRRWENPNALLWIFRS